MASMKDALGDAPPAWGDGYPRSPGWKAPGTSREAAKAIEPSASHLRARCLAHIAKTPSTADETAAALEASVLAIRPRISELRQQMLVREQVNPATGKAIRRKNESGQSATVWEAVPTGPEQKTLPL